MSPSAGRFLGRDPIGYEGSPFLVYDYSLGHLLVVVDPTGLYQINVDQSPPELPVAVQQRTQQNPTVDSSTVQVCCRNTRISILGFFGFPHCWIKTSTESCGRGTIAGKCCNSMPYSKNQQVDHSSEPETNCKSAQEYYRHTVKLRIGNCDELWLSMVDYSYWV